MLKKSHTKKDFSKLIVHVHFIFNITCVTFLHLFYNKTLLFDVFSCLVACRVIKEEKREINRFIQLNLKVQKKGIDSNPEVLKAILS